jgi:cell division protein FtsA
VSGLVDVVRNPIHSTGVGLLLFGRSTRHVHPAPGNGAGARKVIDRMREWFKGNF